MLFDHVIEHGERDWGIAVPGKTGHQVGRRESMMRMLGHPARCAANRNSSAKSSGSEWEARASSPAPGSTSTGKRYSRTSRGPFEYIVRQAPKRHLHGNPLVNTETTLSGLVA